MNLSAPFIYRPIATTLIAIGIAIAGIVAFNFLPISSLPQIEFPTILVQAELSGASSENMATAVVTPLEKALGRISGITDMTSTSQPGKAKIIIQFDLDRTPDEAARDVQAALNAAAADLPNTMNSPPTYKKVNPADSPIMVFALTSDTYEVENLYDLASTILQQRLLKVEGVGQVVLAGSSLPAVRVELNPEKMNKYSIGLDLVESIIGKNNVNFPKGQITENNNIYEIITNDQLFQAEEYRSLIILNDKKGNIVRLSDIAKVTNSVQDTNNSGILNGKKTVLVVVFKSPGANVIRTNEMLNDAFFSLSSAIPRSIEMHSVMDRTTTIKASLFEVKKTLVAAMIFVVIVVFMFLGNIRSMIIPGVAMALSLLGAFAVMWLLGFSLNILSLMALTIATGFVVDDAIVVLENISRYIEHGMSPKEAALKGSEEIGFTVTSISLSLIAVFIPILLMGGIVGRLFREFAVTLSLSIVISLLVSLTLTPMMCAYVLKNEGKLEEKKSSIFNRMKNSYSKSLSWALDHHKLMLLITLLTLVLNIFLFIKSPKGFFPQQDTGRIVGTLLTDQKGSFKDLDSKLAYYLDLIKKDDAVDSVVGYISSGNVNSATIFIILKELEKRRISADLVINRIRDRLSNIYGATLYMQSAQDLVIGGRQSNAQFQYTVTGDNVDEVNKYTPIIMEKISNVPGVIDVNTDQGNHALQVFVEVDYNKAAFLGVTIDALDKALYYAFGQYAVSTIYKDDNQYYVVMGFASEYNENPDSLNLLYVSSSNGSLVPLTSIATIKESSTLLQVNHQGLSPSATISFNLLPGIHLGDAVSLVQKELKKITLPITIQGSFKGTAQAFQSSLSSQPYLILASLLAVYFILGMLYENLIHPITILSTLPSAGVGAVLALILTNTDLSIIAIIGIILLIGIVKKNAIMMIDFVLEIKKKKVISSRDAIYQGAILRFRPIMMTTMAALLGAVPMAIGRGLGAELQQPLGITIIGGLIFSQMLTLYTTPVIYLAMDRFGKK